MTKIFKTTEKQMIYGKRQHIQHPVPRPMEFNVVGSTLSEREWNKFKADSLIPNKLERYSEHRGDGSLVFFGEGGLDAALLLQNKYPERFHFIMSCQHKNAALVEFIIAKDKGLRVLELEYKTKPNETQNVSGSVDLEKFVEEITQEQKVANVKL